MRAKVIVAVVIVLLIGAGYWAWVRREEAVNGPLTASGTIEGTEVNVAAELAGRVVEVLVDEGDTVTAGDVLVRLDGALNDALRAQAEAARDAAVAAVAAPIGPAPAFAAAAKAQLASAEAAVRVLDVQADKLTLRAPASGVILARTIEPGEVAGPGAALLVIGRTEPLTITVFVPEDRYGRIERDQKATVRVDAFADQEFDAVVTHIDDHAQFTPRNVQTASGRKSTVYGVRLRVTNTRDRLKPGMPADVSFDD